MVSIQRNVIRTISGMMADHAIVLVEGPPRCGLSTIARQVAASFPAGAVMLDARGREGRAVIGNPGSRSAARPLILDNAGADEAAALASKAAANRESSGREGGKRWPRLVLVGGPFPGAAGDTGHSGDSAVVTASPLSLFEVGRASVRSLWLRGGYPEAYGAASDEAAFNWLEGYAADLAHGALAGWGLPRAPGVVTGLLEAVAANAGKAFNENAAARALGVSRPTVSRYLSILHRAGILFSVPALPASLISQPPLWRSEAGNASAPSGVARAAKAPALHLRDSGLLHALLGVGTADELALKPRAAAASWAGFVAAQAREAIPPGTGLYRYASPDGAALDLVVVRDGVPVITAAARRLRPASVERSISYAAKAVRGAVPGRFIVAPDGAERDLPGGFTVISLGAFLERLSGT